MRIPQRFWRVAAAALAALTCAFPTDESDKVFVTIEAPSLVVRRGEKLAVSARMYHAAGPDTVPIENVRFLWSSDNEGLATVEATALDSAEVTGVNAGMVTISARAVAFEKARSASFTVRVSNPLEVDSVVPGTVRYGGTITLFGIGVDSIILASLGPGQLIEYPFSRRRDALGFSQITYWVPPPARTDSVFYIGNGVFGFARDTTRVLGADIYEPNDVAWWGFDLDAPRPFPGTILNAFLIFNPALAFEPLARDQTFRSDWYRLRQSTARDLTIVLVGDQVRGTFSTFITDSLYWDPGSADFFIGPDSWTIGPASHACHGRGFSPLELQPESTVVALKAFPDPVLHAIAIYGQPGPYGLAVIEGYVIGKGGFPADRREEDDYCDAADAKGPPYPAALRDTLTIDNGHDVDWIRFRVPDPGGGLPSSVRFRTGSIVPGDTSDIDLYVLDAGSLAELGSGVNTGSTEDFTVLLNPGEYYAVVVDFAGTPTRYVVCIRSCLDPFPASSGPAAAPAAERRSKPRRSSAPPAAPRARP
ncbi:MAG TPA: hypothetical protein VNI61_08465 [Gemmatimonadales bacterium]|nr:hypothetical protein [Gemmatimonadales bacterium]